MYSKKPAYSKKPEKYTRLLYWGLGAGGFLALIFLLRFKDCLFNPAKCLSEGFAHLGTIILLGIILAIAAIGGYVVWWYQASSGSRHDRRRSPVRPRSPAQPSPNPPHREGTLDEWSVPTQWVNPAEERSPTRSQSGSHWDEPMAEERSPDENPEWVDPTEERTHIGIIQDHPLPSEYGLGYPSSLHSLQSDSLQSDSLQSNLGKAENLVKIKVIYPKRGKSQEITLTKEILLQGGGLIGRHRNCDIVLSSPDVSRVHGRFLYLSEQFYYTDLGSTWGSQVNQEKAETNQYFALKPNDIIRIGRFNLLIQDVKLEQAEAAPVQFSSNELALGVNAAQIQRSIFKVEELKTQGISLQGASEFVFQGKRLEEGLSLSKRFHHKAMDLWEAELAAGKFCLLVEHSDHFTFWLEKEE